MQIEFKPKFDLSRAVAAYTVTFSPRAAGGSRRRLSRELKSVRTFRKDRKKVRARVMFNVPTWFLVIANLRNDFFFLFRWRVT